MPELILTSQQQAALNAAGEALTDLGLRVTLSYDPYYPYGRAHFIVTARTEGSDYQSGSAPAMADAANKCLVQINEANANPPSKQLRTARETIAAIEGILEDVAGGELSISLAHLREEMAELQVAE